ncbi:MAG: HutD family protein [Candidatus Eremiobacteraeota bacterium]|nr:HutD family protein [Candidatus Eremiobacteraeota bacterium]MBC5820511.1 HutD family protein [Candidatus Eremiobacteraeota bacterium]
MTDDIAVDEGPAPRWRLSLTTIERAAPFSDFPGYDRTFIVAGGAGVVLRPQGGKPVALDRPGALYAFPGERPVVCVPRKGVTHALNVFALRDRVIADVMLTSVERHATWSPPAGTSYVFVVTGSLEAADGLLRRHDTLALPCEGTALRALEPAMLAAVSVRAGAAS